jgi:hypothetical protein
MDNCATCGNFIPYPETGCKLRISNKAAQCKRTPIQDYSDVKKDGAPWKDIIAELNASLEVITKQSQPSK